MAASFVLLHADGGLLCCTHAAADVLLWRNKKISSSVLGVATLVWVFFEWLDYHFLTILCFVLALGMAVQFAWSIFSSSVPRVQLPEELFASAGAAAGAQVNRALGFLQDVACGRDLKRLVIVSDAVSRYSFFAERLCRTAVAIPVYIVFTHRW